MRNPRRMGILFMILFSFSLRLTAQPESLVIGAGDILHVVVFEAPDLEQRVKVTDSGMIKLTLGGELSVKGLPPSAAAVLIEQNLKRQNFILQPHVTVFVEHLGTQNVSVFGQVRLPGAYAVDTNRSLVEVLSLAGGLNDLADRHVTIRRHDSGERVNYLVANSADQLLESDPMVHPGDTVYVPKADVVYFLGDVNRPGGYAKTTNDSKVTAVQGLALAGGTPPTASPSRARLIRRNPNGTSQVMDINLSAMQKGKQHDIALQADDIVFVPYSYMKNVAVNISSLAASATGALVYQF